MDAIAGHIEGYTGSACQVGVLLPVIMHILPPRQKRRTSYLIEGVVGQHESRGVPERKPGKSPTVV